MIMTREDFLAQRSADLAGWSLVDRLIMDGQNRRSGRTFEMLRAAPDGCVVVVLSSQPFSSFTEALEIMGRRPDCMKFVTCRQVSQFMALRGRSQCVIVDHAVHDKQPSDYRAVMEEVAMAWLCGRNGPH